MSARLVFRRAPGLWALSASLVALTCTFPEREFYDDAAGAGGRGGAGGTGGRPGTGGTGGGRAGTGGGGSAGASGQGGGASCDPDATTRPVAEDEKGITSFVADEGVVYWVAERANGPLLVRSAAIEGCGKSADLTGELPASSSLFTLDATTLYAMPFGAPGPLMRIDRAGGAITDLIEEALDTADPGRPLYVAGGAIYYVGERAGADPADQRGIKKVPNESRPIGPEERVILANGFVQFLNAEVDADGDFALAVDDDLALKAIRRGSNFEPPTLTTLLEGAGEVTGLVYDAEAYYLLLADGAVQRLPRAGGPPEPLAPGLPGGTRAADLLREDGPDLYWLDPTDGATVLRTVPKAGGEPAVIADDALPAALAARGGYIVWGSPDGTAIFSRRVREPRPDEGRRRPG